MYKQFGMQGRRASVRHNVFQNISTPTRFFISTVQQTLHYIWNNNELMIMVRWNKRWWWRRKQFFFTMVLLYSRCFFPPIWEIWVSMKFCWNYILLDTLQKIISANKFIKIFRKTCWTRFSLAEFFTKNSKISIANENLFQHVFICFQ
jgi:hypothetical protein